MSVSPRTSAETTEKEGERVLSFKRSTATENVPETKASSEESRAKQIKESGA